MTAAKITHTHDKDSWPRGDELRGHLLKDHRVRDSSGFRAGVLDDWHHRKHRDAEVIDLPPMTVGELRSILGEGFHTAFRKATDDPLAFPIHRLIAQLGDGEFTAVLDFVIEGLESRTEPAAAVQPDAQQRHEEMIAAEEGQSAPGAE